VQGSVSTQVSEIDKKRAFLVAQHAHSAERFAREIAGIFTVEIRARGG
jgi:hypothetical protein